MYVDRMRLKSIPTFRYKCSSNHTTSVLLYFILSISNQQSLVENFETVKNVMTSIYV